jgi:anti-sigma B factor antagonist
VIQPFTMLSLGVVEVDDATVVAVSGELDICTVPGLRELVASLIAADRVRLVLELSELTFCDAAGAGEMLRCRRLVRERGGRLSLLQVSPQVGRVLRITGLTGVLPAYRSLAESILAVSLTGAAPGELPRAC